MNIGEDDLFMQQVMTRDNVSVVLSPRATLSQKAWGGMGWWMSQLRYYGSSFRFYPGAVKRFIRFELLSRLLFWVAAVAALVLMPLEYKLAVVFLLLARYVVGALEVRRIARRLGEEGLVRTYFLYDLLSPFYAAVLSLMLRRKDERVWR